MDSNSSAGPRDRDVHSVVGLGHGAVADMTRFVCYKSIWLPVGCLPFPFPCPSLSCRRTLADLPPPSRITPSSPAPPYQVLVSAAFGREIQDGGDGSSEREVGTDVVPAALPPSRRGRKGVTVHWPFQSVATDTASISMSLSASASVSASIPDGLLNLRRATVQVSGPRMLISDYLDTSTAGASSPRDSTLIPDYVRNFLRGDTPETVARRKRNAAKLDGRRSIDITHQHRPQHSHMAVVDFTNNTNNYDPNNNHLLQGDPHNDENPPPDNEPSLPQSPNSVATDMQQILPGTVGREKVRQRQGRSLTSGWRLGVVLNLVLVFTILATGFVCVVLAGTKMAFLVGDMDLLTGSCAAAAGVDWGLHALINVAVVVLLVGANYVFQVLASPTRAELAAAHENSHWLEIGIPSLRNLRFIAKRRVALACLVMLVAVVTQVIYNSIIFTTQAGMSYNLIAVTPSFLDGASFSTGSANNAGGLGREELLGLQQLAAGGELMNLSTAQCTRFFSGAFNTAFQNVLLVLDLQATTADGSGGSSSLVETARAGINLQTGSNMSTTVSNAKIFFDGALVDFCLAEPEAATNQTCTVKLNGILFVVILALNLVTLVATATSLLLFRFDPLVTLGDVVASFLRNPDPCTRMNCLLTKKNLRSGLGGWGFVDGKYWAPKRDHRWFRSPAPSTWVVAGLWWIASAGFAAGLLGLTLSSSQAAAVASPPQSSMLTPFGVPSPYTTFILSPAASAPVPAAALAIVTALPQLLLAGLYLSTNALLTSYFLSHESSLYAVLGRSTAHDARRALRVSTNPEGQQTTSLYLTLPRPVSWALAVLFAGMGFTLSQACFVVSLSSSLLPSSSPSSPSASAAPQQTLVGVGFSGVALVVLVVLLAVLAAGVTGLGFLRAPPAVTADGHMVGNPLVFEGGSCSAVVSARSHRVPHEVDVWKQRVSWGVVGEALNIGHATYSAWSVSGLDAAHRYA